MRVGNQRPRLFHLPEGRVSSAAEEACDLAASCGLHLFDWQKWCLDGMLSETADGRWAAMSAVLIMPRQNGKNSVLEALELAGLFLFGWSEMIHTAHEGATAASHMRRMMALVRNNPELDAIVHPYVANGKEALVRKDTGARLEFSTRTNRAGRGKSPQLVVYDEALHLTDDEINSVTPSMSAQSLNPEGMPLQVYTSSAPLASSSVLHRLRNACIDGISKSAFFAEWSCVAGADPYDVDNWYDSNPSLGLLIAEDWIREAELPTMSPEGFAVERMGVVLGDDFHSELPEWSHQCDPSSVMTGKPSIAVDVDPSSSWVSIAVAGARADNLTHVEVVERFTGSSAMHDAALVLKKMHAAHRQPIWLDPVAAAALLPDLIAANVKVNEIGTSDLVKACAHLKQLVRDGNVKHRGQQPLDTAVAGAGVRTVGDGWAWTRRVSTVDISPLVAVTLAAWASRTDKPRDDAWIVWE